VISCNTRIVRLVGSVVSFLPMVLLPSLLVKLKVENDKIRPNLIGSIRNSESGIR
jgi:hypothetical protein